MEIKRCGTCFYGKIVTQDISKRLCMGAPPTAMPTDNGMRMMRPIVSVTDDACALYKDARPLAKEVEMAEGTKQ